MDIESKAMLSLGTIAFTLAELRQSQAELVQAQERYQRVVDIYTSPDTSQRKKERMHRLAAHAYARLGLIIICEPDCDNPAPKTFQEYELARSYYEEALDLLRTTEACRANIEDCLPRDQKSIRAYQDQLDAIQEVLDRNNPEQSSSTFLVSPVA